MPKVSGNRSIHGPIFDSRTFVETGKPKQSTYVLLVGAKPPPCASHLLVIWKKMVILVPHLLTKHSPIYLPLKNAPSLKLTASSPLKIGPQKETIEFRHIPTIHFQVLLLLVSGSVAQTTKMKSAYSVAYIYWNSMASSGIRHFFGGVLSTAHLRFS